MNDVLTRTMRLACPRTRAFEVFTRDVDLWWPRGHRRDAAATMALEARPGGRLLERSADGSEWVLGRLTGFEPPDMLAFDWFPGSPAAPTAVTISFAELAGTTEIRVVHRALGEGAIAAWPQRVALFERGWDTVLPALRDYVDNNGGA